MGWKCPMCSSENNDSIITCVCGYDTIQTAPLMSVSAGENERKGNVTGFLRKETVKKNEIALKPAKGFLYWGGFLTLSFLIFLSKSASVQGMWIVSTLFIPSILVCVLWYWFSAIRPRRRGIPQAFGTILFFFGTLIPPLMMDMVAMEISRGKSFSITMMYIIVIPIIFLVLAFFLHFRRNTEKKENH